MRSRKGYRPVECFGGPMDGMTINLPDQVQVAIFNVSDSGAEDGQWMVPIDGLDTDHPVLRWDWRKRCKPSWKPPQHIDDED